MAMLTAPPVKVGIGGEFEEVLVPLTVPDEGWATPLPLEAMDFDVARDDVARDDVARDDVAVTVMTPPQPEEEGAVGWAEGVAVDVEFSLFESATSEAAAMRLMTDGSAGLTLAADARAPNWIAIAVSCARMPAMIGLAVSTA